MSVAGRGRPLRFLLVLAIAWVSVRIAILWPAPQAATDGPSITRSPTPARPGETATTAATVAPLSHVARRAPQSRLSPQLSDPPSAMPPLIRHWPKSAAALRARTRRQTAGAVPPAAPSRADSISATPAVAPISREEGDSVPAGRSGMVVPTVSASASARSRWSGSAWIAARGGAGLAPGALGGQLGGSQAGARLVYTLDFRRRLALVGRVTTPLGDGLREASLGIEWQPTRLPVRLVVEQRVAVSGGQGGPGIGVIGGFGPIAIGHRLHAESYAQMGVIRRATTEPYVDGALRVTHPVARFGRLRFDLGAGAWGGAQRGAARLDIGPSLGVALPIGAQPVRLALDWRARIAGDANPGSGLALTLGADF